MSLIPNKFLESTVVLGNNDGNGVINWIATGFLVGRYEGFDEHNDQKYSIYLITNKHVVNGLRQIQIQFNSQSGLRIETHSLMLNEVNQYTGHPDENVEVIASRIDINGIISSGGNARFFQLNNEALSLEDMKKTGVCEGSLTYTLGFPSSVSIELIDNLYKSPVCRLGCIAQIENMYHNGNIKNYIIDSETFPGNSGSPVINQPSLFSVDNEPTNNKTNLIGIVSAYLPYTDNLISMQTGKIRTKAEENSGLTIVYPVDAIQQTVELERTRSTGLSSKQVFNGLKY